jgi:voltage-gated sodium channel
MCLLLSIRQRLSNITESKYFMNFFFILILVNAVVIGAETFPYVQEKFGQILAWVDNISLVLFVVEITMRFFAKDIRTFFRDGWNVFDFIIIFASVILSGSSYVNVLRMLRILRVVRSLHAMPRLKSTVNTLLRALPSVGNVVFIMLMMLYLFAVAGYHMFGTSSDAFSTLGGSMITLFQVSTLEGWPDVMRPLIAQYDYAWLYFVGFIIIETFIVLNLFMAIVIKSIEEDSDKNQNEEIITELHKMQADFNAKLSKLEKQLKDMKSDSQK